MTAIFDKVIAWVKANVLYSVLIALAIVALFFWKPFKRMLFGTTRRRKRRTSTAASTPAKRRIPRSVGMNKSTKKKPWQVKGSEAARRHMAKLRRMR